MPDRDELQLIQLVREGNHDAFRELVQRHMKQAYNVAFGFLNDHDEADDISQLAFVKVHQNIASFRGESEFATWLHRIVVNLSMTRLRKRKRQIAKEVNLQDAESLAGTGEVHSDRIGRTQHVERALHELPTLQRAVVILRHLEGLSTRQVSKILDCSEGTVKTHLHRGLRKMRDRLSFLEHEAFA